MGEIYKACWNLIYEVVEKVCKDVKDGLCQLQILG